MARDRLFEDTKVSTVMYTWTIPHAYLAIEDLGNRTRVIRVIVNRIIGWVVMTTEGTCMVILI